MKSGAQSVVLSTRTSLRVLALTCSGRTPGEVFRQLGVPVAVVHHHRARAGWPSVAALRESLAALEARAQGRDHRPTPGPGPGCAGGLGLDDLVNAVAGASNPAVIDALVELQAAAGRLRRVAVRTGARSGLLAS